ncbi:MAG: hypothetical protein JXB00_20755 [Bacteroidales bacterium]|nr:hypothetical protein [Bacteroidales bacterium]
MFSFSEIAFGSEPVEVIATKSTVTNGQGNVKKYPLSAGAAKGDITPPGSILPLPQPPLGTFDRIDNHIFVPVISLYDGEKESLFITFDMVGIPYPQETMQYVIDATGLEKQYIFMSATHTHMKFRSWV